MNPMLSLSVLSSGHGVASVEPVTNEVGAALDNSGGVNKFGRLLDQSGEQQAADRQSFAGFRFSDKNKRLASQDDQRSDRPDTSMPAVVAPDAELTLTEDSNLLGLLDLTSQARLQLTTQTEEKGQTEPTADDMESTDTKDGKKVNDSDGFMLSVDPEVAAADLADSITAGTETVHQQAAGTVTSSNAEPLAQQVPGASNTNLQRTVELNPAAGAELKTAPTSKLPLAGATIFDTSEVTTLAADEGTPGSTLASAGAVAESALARQQQRAGMADTINQTKQALAAGAESGEHTNKVDAGLMAAGQRAESSLSGFGSVFGATGQSEGEAVAARLDAATVASAQQSTERAKAQSVHKSVTEQLKQVNLLAQNATGQLKERINLMVQQNIQVADIRLDPADLGQMQIRVNLQQEQATVQFIVQQQHAKELLEQQMPRLREMLQQQGIQLGEGQVQQQRQGDSQANGQSGRNNENAQDEPQPGQQQATAVQLEVKLSDRIVDYYA